MKWSEKGEHPDYRFSFANERTFLAWVRTALAFLAAAIGLDQLTPHLVTPSLRIGVSTFLCFMAAYFAYMSYYRWKCNEQAIRSNQPLTYTKQILFISLFLIAVSACVATIILL